jgi:hypothetical protein
VSTRYVGHLIDHTEPPLLHALLNSIFPVRVPVSLTTLLPRSYSVLT